MENFFFAVLNGGSSNYVMCTKKSLHELYIRVCFLNVHHAGIYQKKPFLRNFLICTSLKRLDDVLKTIYRCIAKSICFVAFCLEDELKASSRNMAKNIYVDALIDQEDIKTCLPRIRFN